MTRQCMWTLACVLCALLWGCTKNEQSRQKTETSTAADAPKVRTLSLNVLSDFIEERVQQRVHQEQPLRALHPVCKGSASHVPTLHLYVEEPTTLRVHARPIDPKDADLTLAIQSSEGGVICSDDMDGLNPEVDTIFEPGAYNIWVGAHGEDISPTVELHVQDVLAALPKGDAARAVNAGTYGGLALPKLPGPSQLVGQAGGTRNATDIGPGCTGYIGMRPDHVLTLREEAELTLRAHAADADLVLLLQHSSGKVLCNDDADGVSPVIRATMDAGTWNVYVGTFAPSNYPEYVFRVSQ